jgi:hypothetical protein
MLCHPTRPTIPPRSDFGPTRGRAQKAIKLFELVTAAHLAGLALHISESPMHIPKPSQQPFLASDPLQAKCRIRYSEIR